MCCSQPDKVMVLDWFIERKTVEDLISSVKGNQGKSVDTIVHQTHSYVQNEVYRRTKARDVKAASQNLHTLSAPPAKQRSTGREVTGW